MIHSKKGMKRGSSARFLSSCCPSSRSSFPRVVYPRLRVISPFFPWFLPPIHRPPSCLAPLLSPRPLPRLALPPSVAGFPTSPLIVIVVGVPTQQSRWGVASFARSSSSYRPSSRFSPPRRLTTLPPCRLYPSSLGYDLRRWAMPFIVVMWPWSCWAILLVVGSSFVVRSSLVVRSSFVFGSSLAVVSRQVVVCC